MMAHRKEEQTIRHRLGELGAQTGDVRFSPSWRAGFVLLACCGREMQDRGRRMSEAIRLANSESAFLGATTSRSRISLPRSSPRSSKVAITAVESKWYREHPAWDPPHPRCKQRWNGKDDDSRNPDRSPPVHAPLDERYADGFHEHALVRLTVRLSTITHDQRTPHTNTNCKTTDSRHK